jgi:transcription antitermination factor NusG
MTLRWYAVNTYGDAEWEAFRSLQRRRPDGSERVSEVFFPHWLGSWRKHRWHHGIARPHFPGYIFAAQAEDNQSIAEIKASSGVKDVVREGIYPIVWPARVIDGLKRRAMEHLYSPFDAKEERFRMLKVGDWVVVPEGAFLGIPAVVETIDKRGRIEVAVGSLRFTFPAAAFQSAAVSAAQCQ